MPKYASKDALLKATDLKEQDVELPLLGMTVRVKALSASYSNQAASEAATTRIVGDTAIATIDKAKMEAIQLFHALTEPKLESVEEAEQFAQNCGPSIVTLMEVIDEISAIDKEAIEAAQSRFPVVDGKAPAGAPERNGTSEPATGSGGSDVPSRAGAEAGEDG